MNVGIATLAQFSVFGIAKSLHHAEEILLDEWKFELVYLALDEKTDTIIAYFKDESSLKWTPKGIRVRNVDSISEKYFEAAS